MAAGGKDETAKGVGYACNYTDTVLRGCMDCNAGNGVYSTRHAG